jgi:metal-responsive CopG/Arc/MetJ family transcriptional regulator
MASVKTAISLQKSLLDQVDQLARKMDVSRSNIFVLAAEQFIECRRSQELLEAINAAYDDSFDPQEQTVHQEMRRKHRQLAEGQW